MFTRKVRKVRCVYCRHNSNNVRNLRNGLVATENAEGRPSTSYALQQVLRAGQGIFLLAAIPSHNIHNLVNGGGKLDSNAPSPAIFSSR